MHHPRGRSHGGPKTGLSALLDRFRRVMRLKDRRRIRKVDIRHAELFFNSSLGFAEFRLQLEEFYISTIWMRHGMRSNQMTGTAKRSSLVPRKHGTSGGWQRFDSKVVFDLDKVIQLLLPGELCQPAGRCPACFVSLLCGSE